MWNCALFYCFLRCRPSTACCCEVAKSKSTADSYKMHNCLPFVCFVVTAWTNGRGRGCLLKVVLMWISLPRRILYPQDVPRGASVMPSSAGGLKAAKSPPFWTHLALISWMN